VPRNETRNRPSSSDPVAGGPSRRTQTCRRISRRMLIASRFVETECILRRYNGTFRTFAIVTVMPSEEASNTRNMGIFWHLMRFIPVENIFPADLSRCRLADAFEELARLRYRCSSLILFARRGTELVSRDSKAATPEMTSENKPFFHSRCILYMLVFSLRVGQPDHACSQVRRRARSREYPSTKYVEHRNDRSIVLEQYYQVISIFPQSTRVRASTLK